MTEDTILGVERSLLGRRWHERAGDPRAGLAIAQRHNLPEIVGRVLACRGVAPEDAERFLNPLLRECLPDPAHLKDAPAGRYTVDVVTDAGQIVGRVSFDVRP